VLSLIYPFYNAQYYVPAGHFEIYYWSYKASYHVIDVMGRNGSEQFLFSGFWFGAPFLESEMALKLILLFTVQILTLVFGFLYAIFNRRVLSYLVISLSLWIIALMISAVSAYGYNNGWNNYEPGFWLVFPAFALFLSALALNEWMQKLDNKR